MAAKKKKPEEKGAGSSGSTRSLRDDAEKQLSRSRKISPDLAGQTPEELIHELRIHQIELEMQAEELRKSKLALEESRDKYLDLYEFAPTGYLTLTDKGIYCRYEPHGRTMARLWSSHYTVTLIGILAFLIILVEGNRFTGRGSPCSI